MARRTSQAEGASQVAKQAGYLALFKISRQHPLGELGGGRVKECISQSRGDERQCNQLSSGCCEVVDLEYSLYVNWYEHSMMDRHIIQSLPHIGPSDFWDAI